MSQAARATRRHRCGYHPIVPFPLRRGAARPEGARASGTIEPLGCASSPSFVREASIPGAATSLPATTSPPRIFCGRREAVLRTSTTSRSYIRDKPMTKSASRVGIPGKAERIEIHRNRTGTRWRRKGILRGLKRREEIAQRRRLVLPATAHPRPPRDRPAPASPRNTQNHHPTGHMV